MNREAMLDRLNSLTGRIGFCCVDTVTGEALRYHSDEPFVAASVIKLCVLAEAFREREAGELDFDETLRIRPGDKKPSCGALTYMHDGLEVTIRDLAVLMIILSDNTATNLLIDRLCTARINAFMTSLGLSDATRCRRKLFMPELSAQGVTNHVTADDMARLLSLMLEERLVSPSASREMLSILRDQRLNGKMPFYLKPRNIPCAHKTGEDYDDGVTHDVGIIWGQHPMIFCFLAEGADVPLAERAIQDLALMAACPDVTIP